jgi:uncharacterized membrane protein (DUF4010 family)
MESIALKLFLSLLVGAAVGFERESDAKGKESLLGGGVRTFSLVSLIGFLSGLFYLNNLPLVSVFLSIAFVALLIVYYTLHSKETKNLGLTTEMAYILTFAIGNVLALNFINTQITLALVVMLILILSLKQKSKQLISEVSRSEVESFISYAIVALVILPFLPNITYTLSNFPSLINFFHGIGLEVSKLSGLEIINPSKLWFIVVLITGIDVFGYVLGKMLGSGKGFAITSFIGGFISSTSTTQSLANQSKAYSNKNILVGAAILANLASFIQIFLLVGPLNVDFLVKIFPSLVGMIISAGIISIYYFSKTGKVAPVNTIEKSNRKIFSLLPALRFAVLILVVKIITGIGLIYFGHIGFLISSIISSIAGPDPILINLATSSPTSISLSFALLVFLSVNAANLLSKMAYSYLQGSKTFAKAISISLLIIIISSAIVFII